MKVYLNVCCCIKHTSTSSRPQQLSYRELKKIKTHNFPFPLDFQDILSCNRILRFV